MALLDRIKFDGLSNRNWLVYRHPKEDLVLGTHLIVGEGQTAVLVKGGKICDVFPTGTHVLNTDNIPILKSIINIPFGGETPFTAEVYYINTTTKLDMLWGTTDPIQIIDPKYFIRLHIRAFGQFGLKIVDCTRFISELIGAMGNDVVNYNKVIDFYKGILVTKTKSIIADIIINDKISALEITPRLDEISATAHERIRGEFERYGLWAVNFFIQSINFPEEDFDQINKLLEDRAAFEIMGDNRYATKRSFDVYEDAAKNETGIAGTFMAGGVGLGMGAAAAGKMGSVVSPVMNDMVYCPKCNAPNPRTGVFCGSCGASMAAAAPAVSGKKCPACAAELTGSPKFCPECGSALIKKCECGEQLASGVKFCPNCGKKTEE